MLDQKCPFSAPLVTEQFSCQYAESVVRRGGAEIACLETEAWLVCMSCHEKLRHDSLVEMELEDDLTSLPHSVLHRIQLAGLLELQRQLAAADVLADSIDNVYDLLSRAKQEYGDIESFPFHAMVKTVASYKLKRRRTR